MNIEPILFALFLTWPNQTNFVNDEIIAHVCSAEHEEIDCSYCQLYCDEVLDESE